MLPLALTDSTIGEPADIADVGEVALGIVAELGIADRRQHQMGDVGEREIVAVGGESATDFTPMVPAAPARVSTKNCCLNVAES